MICIRAPEIRILGSSIIVSDISLSAALEMFIKKGDTLSVFYKEYVTIYSACSPESTHSAGKAKNLSIKFAGTDKKAINRNVYEALFSKEKYYNIPENVFSGWISIGSALSRQKPMLNIRIKKGSYIRFIYTHAENNIFIENYMQWEEWAELQDGLNRLRREIDSDIKNSDFNRLDENMALIRELIENLFVKLGIPLHSADFNSGEYILLDVYLPGNGIYLPLEILSQVLVQYFVPAGRSLTPEMNTSALPQKFTIIYSNKIDNYALELDRLKNILGNQFDITVISSESYKDYKFDIRDSCYLHFSGHGKIINGKGKIGVDNIFTDRLPYSESIRSAFLNCCFAGLEPDGIIMNLMGNGTEFVIASPYEITGNYDDGFSGITDYYSFIRGSGTTVPFFLNSVKNRNFGLFYRLYGRYNNKI
jgi:hypothetical protein